MYEAIEKVFETIIQYSMLILEIIGTVVILLSTIQAVICLLCRKQNAPIRLAQGISLGLEFMLCSEVLRTIVARDLNALLITGGLVALRAAMTVLVHWKNKREKAEHD